MPVACRVMQCLQRLGVPYQQCHHDRVGNINAAASLSSLPSQEIAVAELFMDAKGIVMAVAPLGRSARLDRLNHKLHRKLERVEGRKADRLFRDCEPGSHPAVARAYGIGAVCEDSLFQSKQVYIESGCHTTLLKLTQEGFLRMMSQATRLASSEFEDVSAETAQGAKVEVEAGPDASARMADKLKRLYQLPAMPVVASQILAATQSQDADVGHLARLIEKDPSLTAQVLRQARSPLYGYRGEIASIETAVTRVLGFERVSQIALSIAASRAFDVPAEGALGLRNFWRHTLHCSLLAQRLAFHVSGDRVNPGLAYMTGLLHNFGLLLLGHLFRPEFAMLNKLADAEPHIAITQLEKRVIHLGQASEAMSLGHGQLGAILLEQWQLPPEVCATAGFHHQPDYEGAHEDYVALVQLANCLLKELEIGDDQVLDDPLVYALRLGIAPELVFEVFEQVKTLHDDINELAAQM